jgi:hypothetical protein
MVVTVRSTPFHSSQVSRTHHSTMHYEGIKPAHEEASYEKIVPPSFHMRLALRVGINKLYLYWIMQVVVLVSMGGTGRHRYHSFSTQTPAPPRAGPEFAR